MAQMQTATKRSVKLSAQYKTVVDDQEVQDACCLVQEDEFKGAKIFVDMLQLWDVHVSLTREVFIASVLKTDNLPSSVVALLKNQDDLGANLEQFCGKQAGDHYAELLKIHVRQEIEIVDAILAGLDPKNIITNWYQNGKKIARFLSCNVRGIKYEKMLKLMTDHLDCTLNEAGFIIPKDWPKSQEEYVLCLKRTKTLSNYIAKRIARNRKH